MQRAVFVAALVLLLLQLVTLATQGQAAEHRHARPATSRVPWYTRVESPEGWVRLDAAKPDEQLTFTVIVTGSGAAELERLFWSRSDPDSADFGEWMSNAAIEQLVSPSVAELQQLYGALAEHGIGAEQVVSHGDSFDVTASVQQAESLLDTRLFRFQHSATGLSAIRQWGSYSLPAAIAEQAELVLGVHTFPPIEQRLRMTARRRATVSEQQQARESSKAKADAAPSPAWVPQALAAFYGVPYPIAPLAYSEVSGAVIEWEEQTFSQDDLAQFANDTATPVAPVDPSHIIGNDTVAYPGIEASLDIQWMEGINAGFEPWFWIINNDTAWMYTFTVQFLTSPDYPAVVSMSYGVPELDNCSPQFFGPDSDCNGVPYQQYQQIVDKQFMKMGLLGVTSVSANSDNGVYNLRGDGHKLGADIFEPNYPGTSAYVTTAGGAEVANPSFNLTNPPPACASSGWQCISGGDEQAVSHAIAGWVSGGGFSNVTLRPAYQAAAVDGYLNSGVKLPDESLWNRSGRAIPDVSAQAFNGYVVDGGRPVLVSGTSMSTPIVAGIFTLLNHDYYAITNSTLGFLNVLLYKGQAAGAGLFRDITVGDNCNDDQCKDGHVGFECAKGWDPVSGLGSPSYPNMRKYVQQLGRRVVERRARKQQSQQ